MHLVQVGQAGSACAPSARALHAQPDTCCKPAQPLRPMGWLAFSPCCRCWSC